MIAFIYCVLINSKLNWLSRNAGCPTAICIATRKISRQADSFRRDSWQRFFHPVTHTVWPSLPQQLKTFPQTTLANIICHHDRHPQLSVTHSLFKVWCENVGEINQMQTVHKTHYNLENMQM